MNALIHKLAGQLQQSLYAGGLLEVLLESVLVLVMAALICVLWRRAAAALRHLVWFTGVASLPLLLCLAVWPHTWPKPLWAIDKESGAGNQVALTLTLVPAANAPGSVRASTPAASGSARTSGARPEQPLRARLTGTWVALGVSLWAVGAAFGLIWITAGLAWLRYSARGATPMLSPEWQELLRETYQSLRLGRPVTLLEGGASVMPVTWGWRRPIILLPSAAAEWPVQRRRLVLLHELAHVKRWDCLTQTFAQMVCALFWLNPLVWLAARRMCVERERACDDLVLQNDCKASDYAAELVAIARSFQPARFAAGIAMARSAQLQGRITAMIDPGRTRRLRPGAVVATLGCMGALVGCLAGTSRPGLTDLAKTAALREQQLSHLETFAAAKEKQSLALATKDGISIGALYQRCFDAAVKGNVTTVTNLYEFFKKNHGQYSHSPDTNGVELPHAACWSPVLEVCLAFDHLANCEPEITKLVADGIIDSIPSGSIYFGGTDPGRGLPTVFEKSSIDGDPFFCLTQNAMADATYVDYLRAMYGGKIYTPTSEDVQRCYNDYLADAQRRLKHDQEFPNEPKQILAGEDVKMVGTNVQVAGQVAVMAINARICKVIFDRNPDRQFYVEESFPLDWMYPHFEPHGLILKLNRQSLAELPEEVLTRDHDYWRGIVTGTVGDMVADETSVGDLAAAVERVYVRHDLRGFTGDPAYVENHYAKAMLSKLRATIAGVYMWRLLNASAEYRPQSEAARQQLIQQADLAFRQAFALCPYSPEAVFKYANFLTQFNRLDDARLVAQAAVDVVKGKPSEDYFRNLLRSLDAAQGR